MAIRIILFALFIGFALMLTGCSTVQTKYIVAEVPQPPTIVRPFLPVADLKDGDDAATVVRAHRAAIIVLQGYAIELETYLNAYRK